MDGDRPPPPIPTADDLAASLSGRVRAILDAAEHDAAAIRAAAQRDADAYLQDARRRVDAFATGRARRIAETADRLLAHAEALAARATRAEQAGRLRENIDTLLDALAAAAEAIAAEAQRDPITLPTPPEPGPSVRAARRPPPGRRSGRPGEGGRRVAAWAAEAAGGIKPYSLIVAFCAVAFPPVGVTVTVSEYLPRFSDFFVFSVNFALRAFGLSTVAEVATCLPPAAARRTRSAVRVEAADADLQETTTLLWPSILPVQVILPILPAGPCAPVAPFAPVGPVAPGSPLAPVAPVGPAGPVAPSQPSGALRCPGRPFGPAGPAGSVPPAGDQRPSCRRAGSPASAIVLPDEVEHVHRSSPRWRRAEPPPMRPRSSCPR